MKTIGVIGGMSWVSTAEYYRRLNAEVARRRGGLHSARVLMTSVDFADFAAMMEAEQWDAIGQRLAQAARDLERGGAECVLLATNTMHRVADAIESATALPFLHIADALADALQAGGVSAVGLLGTGHTMRPGVYHERLKQRGVRVVVPDESGRAEIHRVIFDELCKNIVRPQAVATMSALAHSLAGQGAQAVALACTELTLLSEADSPIPFYDTAELHCNAAVDFALG